ncbi:MAG: hypothetical protein EAZ79_24750 [Oscillatoriales cyanobacterium]|nr:MAG: hypothetical protein EAZ79_24750 [Oscillatoriales cyanobacterium]
MDSTVISDAVNLASRVETMTKSYGVSMLITNNTFLQLNVSEYPKYAIRNIGRVRVKGKSELVTIHEVFDADPPFVKEGKLATFNIFLEALWNYTASKHKEAAQLFAECVRKNPLDCVAQNYLKRSQEMQSILSEGKSDFF